MKVCKMGLESIWIDYADGSVRICGWPGYRIGRLTEHSIEELWRGERAEEFRKSLLDGSYRFCNRKECPYMANGSLERILTDYTELAYPKFCNLSYEEQCNYVCRFCRKEPYRPKQGESEKFAKIEKELSKFIYQLDTLGANGVGELFCSDSTLKLLGSVKLDETAKIELESNGSLFNEKNWTKIKNLGEYYLKVYITVHSFREDTYQFLSGTKLPVQNIVDNLHFIKGLREKNIINEFTIASVVCERNFREMPSFVKRCLDEFNPDKVRLKFFSPYGVNNIAYEWFYDIRNPYHPYYDEFKKVMLDPIFQNPKVWKWQGETSTDLQEHPYIAEHKRYTLLSQLFSIDNLDAKIEQYMTQNAISRFALYGNTYIAKPLLTRLDEAGIKTDVLFDSEPVGENYKGHPIEKPSSNIFNYDAILVTAFNFFDEIKKELERMGFSGKIINIEDFVKQLVPCCEN